MHMGFFDSLATSGVDVVVVVVFRLSAWSRQFFLFVLIVVSHCYTYTLHGHLHTYKQGVFRGTNWNSFNAMRYTKKCVS